MSASSLKVPGASLSYTVSGSGSLLLFISGASGNPAPWRGVAPILSSSFTVCCYCRRGFKESHLEGPQDYTPTARLAQDADDAAALIKHLSPHHPAYVVGSGSGAIVGLGLLHRHPEVVRSVICHEPPLTKSLSAEDGPALHKMYTDVYDIYRERGILPAIETFTSYFGKSVEAEMMRQAMSDLNNKNEVDYWMEHELRQYTAIEMDYQALREHNSKLFMIYGRDSRGTPLQATTESVAKLTGAQARMVPGGHLAMASTPQEFAEAVTKIFLPTPPHMWPVFVP